ncbi:MAG: hypothetical protein U1D25_15310 [Hydrogenophaga sp.]|uniref:hypothetical protein n=1 Tax=Hydrogenophaga sp. TaxID=1904254 RepID=UPI0027661E43|nr:hypothetical protein [Hydrogenophaga sp.]MDP2416731.1 hypothetical protein [Hydrogenophaga sp.]MDZ4189456.1 hypothetical protein [Hydrogenophaga sp.]
MLNVSAESPCSAVYQPDQLRVRLAWTDPTGSVVLTEGFWAEWSNFSGWVARYIPTLKGQFRMDAWLVVGDETVSRLGQPVYFTVAEVDTLPQIGVDTHHPGYFTDQHGRFFFPIGVNLAWATGNVLQRYRVWLDNFAKAGGNLVRIWMSSWCFGIEWQDTGLGNYHNRQIQARQLDQVLSMAQARGVRVILCLLNHGAFSLKTDSEWAQNPYNRRNGGPIEHPQDFFTDEAAIACFENRVRYIAARWSHCPALHSWEWWNEVTWVPHAPGALLHWLQRMSHTMHRYDPYRRLQTSSWADAGPSHMWNQAGLDYAHQHDYTPNDLGARYQQTAEIWRQRGYHRPIVPGELGARSKQPTQDLAEQALHRRQFHDGLWAPFMLGYASTALYWWWDHFLEAQQQWHWLSPFQKALNTWQSSGMPLRQLPPGRTVPPPAAACPEDETAMPTLGLECWLRDNGKCLVTWLRRPGLIGGEGELIPATTFVWHSNRAAQPKHSHAWRGHFLQTDALTPVSIEGKTRTDGGLNIHLPAFRGSAVFWLQAQGS